MHNERERERNYNYIYFVSYNTLLAGVEPLVVYFLKKKKKKKLHLKFYFLKILAQLKS